MRQHAGAHDGGLKQRGDGFECQHDHEHDDAQGASLGAPKDGTADIPLLFCCSVTGPMVPLNAESSVPPTECIELDVDPRRG